MENFYVPQNADEEHNIAVFEWEKGTAESISGSVNHRLKVKIDKNNPALYETVKGGEIIYCYML